MAFEEKIYRRFLILTKKRYMCLECDENGNILDKISWKGVLLARRDNNKLIRNIYKELVMLIFGEKNNFQLLPINTILELIVERMNEMCANKFALKDFIVTKSIGEISDYKVRELSTDAKKRAKRLADLKCTLREYHIKALPAQVQLAEKMRARGSRVDAGSRLEYVITDPENVKGKVFEKIEDPEYVKAHGEIIKLDYMYYLKLCANPLDQLLEVVYKLQNFVLNQYKMRLKRLKYLDDIKKLSEPILVFQNE